MSAQPCVAGVLSGDLLDRSAYCQSGQLERWLADAYGHTLAVLTTRAHAWIQGQVVADHGYLGQASGPLPISVAPFTGEVTWPSSIR